MIHHFASVDEASIPFLGHQEDYAEGRERADAVPDSEDELQVEDDREGV